MFNPLIKRRIKLAQPKYEEIEEFSLKIIDIVNRDRIPYLDAITEYCDKTGIEIEMAAKLVSVSIKSHLLTEAIDSRLIKKRARLPI